MVSFSNVRRIQSRGMTRSLGRAPRGARHGGTRRSWIASWRLVCVLVVVSALTVAGAGQADAVRAKRFPTWSGFGKYTTKTKSVPVVPLRTHRPRPAHRLRSMGAGPVAWPTATSSTVSITGRTSRVAVGTPVTVAAAGVLTAGKLGPSAARRSALIRRAAPVSAATVSVASHAAARAAGVAGVMLSVASPAAATSRSLSVSVDYARFANAYGGDYASRLRLVELPACALTTPSKPSCQTQTPVPAAVNDLATHTLRADLTAPTATSRNGSSVGASADTAAQSRMVLAAAAAPSGGGGNFTATSLAASGSWSVGNTGAFDYSYPITTPASIGGDAPTVDLSYDSASVDGRTSATNSQASWVGDGWDYSPGYIERSYKSCADDGHSDSGDECWSMDNATLSLNGHSNQLVQTTAGGTHWRLQDDDGSTVDEISVSSTSAYYNGLNAGTYWRVTANDGTQYFFGADHLPSSVGGSGTDSSTNAAWSVPVYGDDSGEPCHGTTFATSKCTQGWRWNLDFVVDPHNNIAVYHYATETNYFETGTTSSHSLTSYVRAGELAKITYGQQVADYVAKTTPGDQIIFATTGRCDGLSGFSCGTAISSSNASHFPDVPYDQDCEKGSTSCTNYSPTFWSTQALTSITTQVWDESLSTPAWSTVDTYAMSAPAFPDPGDAGQSGGDAKPALWLNSITHTGNDTDGGGSAVAMSALQFGGAAYPNRVGGLQLQGVPPINRFRLTSITTETGENIAIDYDTGDTCDRANPPAENNDTTRCYPTWWTPTEAGYTTPQLDWFYTYPVTRVDANDSAVWGTHQSPTHTTTYAYTGAAWHRDDSPFTTGKTRTWNQFRGYRTVTTETGAGSDPITETSTSYLQGMDGDYTSNTASTQRSVSVTTATGDTITDANYWSGQEYQSTTYSGDGGSAQARTITIPWASSTTATETISGVPNITSMSSRYTDTARTDTLTLTAAGTWRTARVVTAHSDTTGLVTSVDDLGQIDSSGNPVGGGVTPEKCTTTSYAADTTRNMLDYPDQVVTTAGGCSSTFGASSLSGSKTLYGSSTPGTIASTNGGDPTSVTTLKTAPATPVWTTAATSVYDTYGRATTITDPMGRKTTTSYGTTATLQKYPPIATVATNNAGQTTTTTLDPERQLPLTVTDTNNRVTTETYDGLGRLTQVWLPNRAKATHTTTPSMKYAYQDDATDFVAVTTSTLLDGGQYNAKIDIYDGLLQLRQEQTTPGNLQTGARLISNTSYDSHGWAVTSDAAFYNDDSTPSTTPDTAAFSGDIPAETRTTYDGQGRATTTSFYADGTYEWQTATAYPGADETDTTPPTGGVASDSITDARGEQTQLIQDPGGPNANTTYYTYDAAGRQTKIAGPITTGTTPTATTPTWTTSYDALGNVVQTTDPDTGTTSSTYDNDSALTQTSTTGNEPSATTRVLGFDHASDPLGRLTAEYNGTVASGTKIATWTYDTATSGKGQLAGETEYAANGTTATYTKTVAGYTALYKPTSVVQTVPAGTYGNTADITYEDDYSYTANLGAMWDDNITENGAASLMPTEEVSYGLGASGLPVTSGGLSTYESDTEYDPHGRVTRAVDAAMPNQVAQTYSWDEPTGRLTNYTYAKEDGTSAVDNVNYTYTAAGQITSTSDTEGGDSGTALTTDLQCYRYDSLDRLTDVWTDDGGTSGGLQNVGGTGACTNTTPTTSNVSGGPAPYWQSYAYDLTGNRTARTDHATATGGTTTNTAETYTGTGDAHPVHTVTTGTTTSTYAYDGGRPTTTTTATNGTVDPTKTQTYTWSSQGNVASITTGPAGSPTHTSTFGYDPEGNQIARTTDGTTTLLLGQDTITLTSGTATQIERQYPFPGGPTAVRVATASTPATSTTALHWQADNPQGTATTDITASGLTISRQAYTPFGESRSAAAAGTTFAASDLRGFLNAPTDSADSLTTLGAREYNPALGAFISPDPVLNPGDAQSLNGYAYSGNDPTNNADPSGLCPPDKCGGGERKGTVDGSKGSGCGKHCYTTYDQTESWNRTYTYYPPQSNGGWFNAYVRNQSAVARTSQRLANVNKQIRAKWEANFDLHGGLIGGEQPPQIVASLVDPNAQGQSELVGLSYGAPPTAHKSGSCGGFWCKAGLFVATGLAIVGTTLITAAACVGSEGAGCVEAVDADVEVDSAIVDAGTDAAASEASDAPSSEPELFYHNTMSAEIRQQIVDSGRLLGKANRYTGDNPIVRAWRGALPEGRMGVEFTTEVPTTAGTRFGIMGNWAPGTSGVDLVEFNGVEHASIPIQITMVG